MSSRKQRRRRVRRNAGSAQSKELVRWVNGRAGGIEEGKVHWRLPMPSLRERENRCTKGMNGVSGRGGGGREVRERCERGFWSCEICFKFVHAASQSLDHMYARRFICLLTGLINIK